MHTKQIWELMELVYSKDRAISNKAREEYHKRMANTRGDS